MLAQDKLVIPMHSFSQKLFFGCLLFPEPLKIHDPLLLEPSPLCKCRFLFTEKVQIDPSFSLKEHPAQD